MKKALFLLLLTIIQPHLGSGQSSLFLSGPTNWVSVGDLDVPGNQLTVEALIHYTGASVNIVSKHTDPSNVNYLLRIGVFEITTTNGYANFGGVAAAGVTFIPNRTYHVAATYDGAFLRYYVNGCQTGQMAWSGNMVQNNLLTAIGNQSNCQCEQFTGYIDEVRIWNVARSQAQIAANMLTLPAPATQAGLMGYWNFNANYLNLQGNATFNGTAVGAPQFQLIPYPLPSPLYGTATSSNPICFGEASGLINASSCGSYQPHEYSLDGINFTANPVFPNLSAGNYTVYIRPQGNASCVVTQPVVLVNSPPLNANLTTTPVSCFGGSNGTATVAPSGGNGPDYSLLWLPQATTVGSVNNLAAGSYSVVVSDSCRSGGAELVPNGTFDGGATGFTSDYTHCTNCIAGANNLNEGQYLVAPNGSTHHIGFFGTGHGGGGNFLNVNGGSTPNSNVWCQTISVNPNTYYFFSAWVASLHPSSPAILQFSINGAVQGIPFVASAVPGNWNPFFTTWFSGSSTSATICIVNQNTQLSGNDFGLDDISFKECISCELNVPYTITEPAAIQVPTTQVNTLCAGSSNGSATVSPTGGTAPYLYSWNTVPVQTAATAGNLSAGTYSVTVTDANNCTQAATVNIMAPPPIQLSTTQTNIPCAGGSVGSATVNPSGGNGPYTYSWNTNPPQFTQTASNLPAGTYSVIVSDASLCTQSVSVTIIESSAIQLSTSQNNVSCAGGNNGSATVSTFGGNSGYTYAWSTFPVQTSITANGLLAGTYTVTVTDGSNCTQTASVTILEPAALQLSAVQSNVTCAGGNAGSATASVTGGTGPYGFAWNTIPVQSTPTANNLTAGTYTVSVTDALNCSQSTTITISEPTPIQLSATQTTVSCAGGSDGTATVNPTGGIAPFSFSWNTLPLQSAQTANNLTAGTYSVIVTDAANCTQITSVIVTEPLPVQLTTTGNDVTCFGGSNGSATVIALGGTGSYSYTWSTTPIQSSQTALGLGAGTFTVTVSDANSCTQIASVVISEPLAIQLNTAQTDVNCAGGNNGSATVNAIGGSGSFNYSWSTTPVQFTSTANALVAGSYTVTVTDAANCTQTASVIITEPLPLQLSAVQSNVTCAGGNAGSATANVIGGTGPYGFIWNTSPTQSTPTAVNLTAGSYTVTVTDALNCSQSTSIIISEPTPIQLSTSPTPVSCAGGSDGSASVNPSGGIAPFSYSWNTSPPQTTQSASNLPAGNYAVIVTDAANCTQSTPVTITEPSPIQLTTSHSDATCFGGNNGGATVIPSGGTGGFSFNWNTIPVQTSQTASGLSAGTYAVTVSDGNACTQTASLVISEPAAIVLSTTQTEVSCAGGNNGSVSVTASGGTGGFSYSWNTIPVQTTQTAGSLLAGSYTVTVTDVNNCSQITSVTISEPIAISLVLDSKTDPRCHDSSDGSVSILATGGTGAYAYQWSPGVSSASFANNLVAGTYSIIVTDANSCTQTLTVILAQAPAINVAVTASPSTVCLGQPSTLTAVATGGTGSLVYQWSNALQQPSQSVLPVSTTLYQVSVTDSLNCTLSDSVWVTVIDLQIDLGTDTSYCNGTNYTLDAGSGFAGYLWQDGSNLQTYPIQQSGTYHVQVTDTNGCQARDTMKATIYPLPDAGLPTQVVFCPGATAAISGSTGFSSYVWNTGDTSPGIEVSNPGIYWVMIVDSNGCSNMDSVVADLHPVPVLNFDVLPGDGCAPLATSVDNVSVLNGSNVTTWSWSVGSQTSFLFEPDFIIPNPGLYSVYLQATTADGCAVDTSRANIIQVYPVPVASAYPSKSEYDYFDPEIILYNTSTNADSYGWFLSSNLISNSTDLVLPITDTGQVVYQLVAANVYGCTDTAYIPIKILPGFELYFPNAFTPNGNDQNELFFPKGVGIKEYRLQIYDRWGQLVFESQSIENGWDGTFRGAPAVVDTYIYKCIVNDFRGKQYESIGKVTLVR